MTYRPFLTAILGSSTLAAAGCGTTTVADLQHRPPRQVFKTEKPVEEITQCLVESLGRLGAPHTYKRNDGTTVLHFTYENDASAVFTFSPGQLEVRTISKFVRFRSATQACL